MYLNNTFMYTRAKATLNWRNCIHIYEYVIFTYFVHYTHAFLSKIHHRNIPDVCVKKNKDYLSIAKHLAYKFIHAHRAVPPQRKTTFT